MKNLLLINTMQPYSGIAEGTLNETIASIIKNELIKIGYTIKETIIDKGYIVDDEIDKHLWADVIVTQSPVYWFGTPWIYKKYIDEVFTAAIMQQKLVADDGRTRQDPTKQYGTGGKMQNKKYMLSLTWNAPEIAFNNKDQYLFEGKSVDDIFANNTSNYKFCGATIIPSFSFFDVVKNLNFDAQVEKLKKHLINNF